MTTLLTDAAVALVEERVGAVLGRERADHVVALLRDTVSTWTATGDDACMITGDIPAMWLRDSCAQLSPFLRLSGHLPDADRAATLDAVSAVLRRQWRQIVRDPYANAFVVDWSDTHWDPDDQPPPGPGVWERKFELDSLAFPVLTAARVRALGGDAALGAEAAQALRLVVETLEVEQQHRERSPYWFVRPGGGVRDTLAEDGAGQPCAPTGLLWAGFRPSDDACELNYNIPGNLLAARALDEVPGLLAAIAADDLAAGGADPHALEDRAARLAASVRDAVLAHGTVPGPHGRPILAYEVDGLGNALVMDDANNPSLISLPFLGCLPAGWEQLYADTRAVLLSKANPWWFSGRVASGIGSSHTEPGRVWPIALATQGLTSSDVAEQDRLIETLVATTAGTGQMHEAFDVDDPSRYTRDWFSWANAMFCELVLARCGL